MIETLYQIEEKYDTDITDGNYYELLNYKGKELRCVVSKYSNTEDYNYLIKYENWTERKITTKRILGKEQYNTKFNGRGNN